MHQFSFPPNVLRPHNFDKLVICRLFADSHFNSYEMISHFGFDLHFSDNQQWWAFLHMPVGHLYVFGKKKSFQVFCPFLIGLFAFLLLSCMRCLYSLDINPLSIILYANIFSHSVGCPFVLSMISFAVQKLLSVIISHFLFLLLFILL